jgi:hypothetical protein
MKNKRQQMKCPECGEVSTFSHGYQVRHSAPVVLVEGEITIDYDNEKQLDPDDDEDTCTCDKCGSEVDLDNIEVVEIRKVEA